MLKPRVLIFCAFIVCLAGVAHAQSTGVTAPLQLTIVPLTIEKGVPLQVVLTEKLRYKVDEPVHGRIIDPIYAFDREVLPAGTEIVGRITVLPKSGIWKRVSSMLRVDFTSSRNPQITFDALVLEDGTHIPIETTVEPATAALARFTGDTKPIPEKTNASRESKAQALTDTQQHGSSGLLKGMLWSLSPYHPQAVPIGMKYRATLREPLELGSAILGRSALVAIGTQPLAGSVIYARLVTPLDSRTTKAGAGVEALLTRPLFSPAHVLIYPVGSRLEGEVVRVRRAGRMRHGGEMAFNFTKIELPLSPIPATSSEQAVEGRLVAVQAASEMGPVRIDRFGSTRVVASKERFLSPAFAVVGVTQGFHASSESLAPALAGAYSGSVFKRLLGGSTGFGMAAGVAGRMIPPVGIGLGLFGAARSIFGNLLARGDELDFPEGTFIEVRLDAVP
jgi:hypothetical protein